MVARENVKDILKFFQIAKILIAHIDNVLTNHWADFQPKPINILGKKKFLVGKMTKVFKWRKCHFLR